MKIILLLALLSSFHIFSQEILIDSVSEEFIYPEKLKRSEIAFTFLTANLKNNFMLANPDSPIYEFLNGVLFRYKFNSLSLRLNASFFEQQFSPYYNYCPTCAQMIYIKQGRIGAGIQYTPLRKREFIYSYLDAGYRWIQQGATVNEMKILFADTTYNHSVTMNGLDLVLGIGTKLKIFRNLYFSAEIGYDQLFSKDRQDFSDIFGKNITSISSAKYYKSFVSKVYLSVTF